MAFDIAQSKGKVNNGMAKRRKKQKTTGIVLRVGRPNSYDTAEEFQAACVAYFKSLKRWNMPNIAGLCVFLGISRDTWYEYKKKRKELTDTVRNVQYLIESCWLDRLPKPGAIGAIFYLKNFLPEHYKDRIPGDAENPFVGEMRITGMRIIKETKK